MSEAEARDAYLYVEIDHPNGHKLRGKMVRWGDALAIMASISEWHDGAPMKVLEQARTRFLALTDIPESAIGDLSPGAMVNFMYRFFGQLPLAPTVGPKPAAESTVAPASDPSDPMTPATPGA
ncbi:MAG: hypothetical protein ACRDGN_18440 [bacterium]